MDKKGSLAAEQPITLIALLVGLALMIFWVTSNSSATAEIAVHQACGISVAAKSIDPDVVTFDNPLDLNCKTETGVVKAKTKNEALEQISKDALECWVQYGQGEVDFIEDMQGIFTSKSDIACFICSEKTFANEFTITWDDIVNYMKTHGPKNKDWKYNQVLRFWTPKEIEDAIKLYEGKIESKYGQTQALIDVLKYAPGAGQTMALTLANDPDVKYVAELRKKLEVRKQSELYKGMKLSRSKGVTIVYYGQKFSGGALSSVAGHLTEFKYDMTIGTASDLSKICGYIQESDYYKVK